jgi:hypothetical protein
MLLASFGPYRPMPNTGKADVDARTPRLPLHPRPCRHYAARWKNLQAMKWPADLSMVTSAAKRGLPTSSE